MTTKILTRNNNDNSNSESLNITFLDNINYAVLERDMNKIIYSLVNNYNTDKKKINNIKEQLLLRINKLCHNLSILDKEMLERINNSKSLINKNTYIWNKYKQFTNDYEMIYNNKNMISLVKKNPLSRSYFKMIEIGNKYLTSYLTQMNNNGIKSNNQKIKTLHLAEGPGGFIEALIDLRKKYNPDIQEKDLYYGISLTTDVDIPGWDKSTQFLKKNNNVKIITGLDGTGDLINVNNIKYIHTRFKNNKFNIITADGGFNFSGNQYIQEYNASLLIFSELVTALGSLEKGGTYIYKIYDMNYKISADILYLTQKYFENIEIFKPFTSRSGNSEKYVICQNFIGCEEDLDKLIDVLENWININNINERIIYNFIRSKIYYEKNSYNLNEIKIIDNILTDLPTDYTNGLININNYFNEKQIENIDKTINLEYNLEYSNNRIIEQCDMAKSWCKINNIDFYDK